MKNTKGFTLIELLVVVLIIGILAAMALPQYFKAVEKSKSAEAIQVLGTLAQAEQRFYLIHDKYSTTFEGLDIEFMTLDGKQATGATLATNNFKIDLSTATTADSIETGYVTAERAKGGETTNSFYKLTKCLGNGKLCCTEQTSKGRLTCTGLGFDESTTDGDCCKKSK